MEDHQVVVIENMPVDIQPAADFKIISNETNLITNSDPEEIIEYCLDAATNVSQPVKNDGDHDTFSDEGIEKVLTTLETIQTDGDHDEEETYSTYEIEDLPEGDQVDRENNPASDKETLTASEIARIQLEGLAKQKVGRPKKSQVTVLDEKGNVSLNKLSPMAESNSPKSDKTISPNGPVISARPVHSLTLVSPILTKEEVEKEVCEAVMSPMNEITIVTTSNDNDSALENQVCLLTESPNTGAIEIPRELITGNALTSPIYVPNTSKSIQNEDLLAILEGNDDSFEDNKSTEIVISAEDEKAIAMKQIMSLPANPRGRRPNLKSKKSTKGKASDLVNSLVSDWSDNDSGSKKGESEGEIEKPKPKIVRTPKSTKPAIINVQIENDRSERRSRVIKKKIIWDPDAPETAFSYASLVQSTSKKPKIVQTKDKESEETNDARKRKSDSTSPANSKKKRVGEIDKLLADEGAINILNALKHENNNADVSDTESSVSDKIPNKRLPRKVNVEANEISSSRPNESTKPDIVNQKSPRKPKTATLAASKKEVKKRGPNKSAASSWDYIYNDKLGQRGDDSMIIRRRSNSSYSSTASLSRLSIEAPPIDNEKTPESREKAFEFAKPIIKKTTVSDTLPQKQLILSDLRGKIEKKGNALKSEGENAVRRSSRALVTELVELTNVKAASELQKKPEISSNKRKAAEKSSDVSTYQEIIVKTMKHYAHIQLKPASGKLQNSFSVQMMEEVTKALKDLSTNSTIKAVLMSSCNSSFSSGVDYSNLVQGTADKRKQSATDLSTTLRNFITSIVKFKKILIAAVGLGHTIGIGVTILPLFDVIFASNKSTFSTAYAKIGQVPENGTIFAKSNKISHRLKIDLLYLNETIKASDALQCGLVTKVFNSDVFETEIIHQTELLALQSSQSMEATKSLTQFDIIDNMETDLANEQKLLIQHWISTECQDKFKQFLLKEKW